MSEKNQDKFPAESTPPPYASTVPQGQQYEQYPQGYSQTHEYAQIQPPQGYSHGTGYQPVAQGYEQQDYPQTHHYGQQPMYGGQGPFVVVAQPVTSTMIMRYMTTAQSKPFDWFIPALLACFYCFWPTGICAIVAACISNRAAASGNMQSAERSARTARNLTILSIVLGLICVVIIIEFRDVVLPTSGYTHYT